MTERKRTRMEGVREMIADARRFFLEELWNDLDRGVSPVKRMVRTSCRIVTIVIRGFLGDNCGLQSSALTYITLMSMVPVLAFTFSASKGFGTHDMLIGTIGLEKHEIPVAASPDSKTGKPEIVVEYRVIPDESAGDENTPGNVDEGSSNLLGVRASSLPEPMQKALVTVFNYVEKTSVKALGLFGLLLMLLTVVKAMSKLEQTFNHIWGVRKARPFFRKMAEYFLVLILIPFIFLAATAANAALGSGAVVAQMREVAGPLAIVYQQAIRLSGLLFICGAFTFLYMFMPNTRVRLFPGMVGGFTAGVTWSAIQILYISAQIGLAKYNAIYGTFAAVPFFLAWVYANWTIVLLGVEVSFAVQHHRTYILESGTPRVPPAAREMLAMVLTYEICRSLHENRGPWSLAGFSDDNAVPARLISDVLDTLAESGILAPVAGMEGTYVPARDLAQLTVGDVEAVFRHADDPMARSLRRVAPKALSTLVAEKYSVFHDGLSANTFRDLIVAETATA
ncbi:MAG: YihY family inner membrane protein [Lentisphaeria bacterium]|nr:YihY family inner membrane protein [Lentisphaeria bacterium]